MLLAMTKGIDLNTEAHVASSQGDHTKALTLYQEAVDIKVKAYGENSHHVCSSLSGLSDAYLSLGDKANSLKEAKRMLAIARKLKNSEQVRIAREILTNCLKP
jgi:tetratricopeptide (TPR) repeat protein